MPKSKIATSEPKPSKVKEALNNFKSSKNIKSSPSIQKTAGNLRSKLNRKKTQIGF